MSVDARLGLLAVAFANLLVTAALGTAALLTDGTFAGDGHVNRNGVFFGQGMVLGTLTALAPKRGLAGLAAIIACVLPSEYVLWLITLSYAP